MGTIPDNLTREDVRQQLRVYMSKTGIGISELASRSGYAPRTINQFMSHANYGDAEGKSAARRLAKFMNENPTELPELPGRLYETAATREMDRLIDHAMCGGWGTIYGGAGSQKSFLLEYRAAEAARNENAPLVLIEADPTLTPCCLMRRVARGMAAPYAQHTEAAREAILYTLRKRKSPVAVVLDEADKLYRRVDTLETLRRLGDVSRGRMGILVVGNEDVLKLFEPRRGIYFEQWRSRIEQMTAKVLGPSRKEAMVMAASEMPFAKQPVIEDAVEHCLVLDPESKKKYVSARRLFHRIRMFQREIAKKAN